MKTKILIFSIYTLLSSINFGQVTGKVNGKVTDRITKESLPGVNVVVLGTERGSSTDINGEFSISGLEPGTYQVRASFIGYNSISKSDVVLNSAKPAFVDFKLLESVIELEGVTVTSELFDELPTEVNSVKKFSYEEIRRAPGGFEDVIRALSVLPGVARQSAGRNDLVVRGGAPSENLYVVDGFVIPNINHFGSQGATGGPLSFINLDYVNETTFSTGGFQANYGDKLSSVLKIDLREGRKDRIGGKALISASQFGFNLEGPVSEKSNFLFSVRRSYLDFIFNAAGFNFVPEYYDLLAKYTYDIDNSNKLSYLFIGALNDVKFNNNDREDIFDNARILGNKQNQYTTGISYRHLFDKGFYNITLNRNYVDFDAFQNDTLLNPIFLNKSKEAEHELKADVVYKIAAASEVNFGVSAKYILFESDVLFPEQFVTTFGETLPITSLNADEDFIKYSAFGLYSASYFNRLRFNIGVRANYFTAIDKSFTISPRFSMSYALTHSTNLNFSTGIYRQSPSYIWLTLPENRSLKPIRVDQYIFGIGQLLREDIKVKIEAFYKDYSNYPTSELRPYLVLANTGVGFGGAEDNYASYGLEPLISNGKGFSRGIEFSMQKKSTNRNHYGIASITYSQSKFTSLDGVERSGQYDQRWIVSLSAGYIFNEKWEASLKFRYATGSPYTPYNFDGTQSIGNYLIDNFRDSHALDVRVDRRWNFDGWALVTYIDIQNIYNQKNISSIRWNYAERKIEESEGIGILPSIGISLEF